MDYIAIIYKEPNSDFGVSFPDFPGCVTAGRTLDEAKDMAAEALTGHIEVMHETGEPVPDPPTLDDVMGNLAIPGYDGREALHRELTGAAVEAEWVAAMVPLLEGAHFMRQRCAIRDALAENGITATIDALVSRLLDR